MKKTNVLYLPGDAPRPEEIIAPSEVRERLTLIQTGETTDSMVRQAAQVGRATMYLLGNRLYAQYQVSQQAMEPGSKPRQDPQVKHEVSLHNSTISGDPDRVSVVAITRWPDVDSKARVISLPQEETAADLFDSQRSGLFIMDGTTRHFAWDEPELYSHRLAHSAGLLLDIMDQVEVVLPEADELEDRIAA